MIESDYTRTDRAWNAFTRLINQLAELRQNLCECSQVLADPKADNWHGIAEQIKSRILELELMNQDASTRWAELEAHVSEAVAKLAIERPVDYVTWGSMILDKSWRSWNMLNRRATSSCDEKTMVTMFARCAETLEAFDDPKQLHRKITNEFQAVAALKIVPILDDPMSECRQDPFEFEYESAIKLLGVDAKRKLIANEIYNRCSPKQKKKLCSDYSGKDGAIAKLVKDIDNLRGKRKREVDSR